MITALREELRKARALTESGDSSGALCAIDRAMAELADTRMVSMDEAAELLGVKSPEALAPIMHGNGIPHEWRDGRPFVALSEVERVAGSAWVERMQELDRLHDLSWGFGCEPMTPEELEALEAGRPGRLPWELGQDSTDQLT